ncbi:ATP synthase F1 subunit gamma [Candidatus Adlerbacteria bacterium RIFOXYC1_FULL_48_26]|uniref:ATP synthase gamma chain n=1 Tax=Candidatus Adlerbacteria bacterium RIFOXYC1_FULL_48_26 TaxID=1797247 RepID=A0A1F4Y3Y2_9BACT|nr:MAG: ATP synthase F1 subunit gamma [Candidatus Adlerbacteria bacterium RIFOXYC1_FULL_48_26]OGC93825.1 MAG: ATP synthase F1 subunit gamma [Candidatus Adlerbacteria bacterium RIFOXYB1_FULL_48_10]
MAGLKQIKSKIRSYEKTQTVTKAMEAVSAAKMRKAQLQALGGRPYATAALSILARLSGTSNFKNHKMVQPAHNPAALYIVITSDKGLAGSLNSGVLRKIYAEMGENTSVIAVGKKANDFFTSRNVPVTAFHSNNDKITPELIDGITLEALNRFNMGVVGTVKIAYQNFISTLEQKPAVHTMLPLSIGELQHLVEGITPTKGVFSEQASIQSPVGYSIELDSEIDVLTALTPKLVSIFVYHALLESHASEHSARMVSMKSASDKAGEMEHKLTLQFNKARQAAITREVSEIIGGMEAMAN